MMSTEQDHDGLVSVGLDSMTLDRVDAFKYLVSLPSAHGKANKEITGQF